MPVFTELARAKINLTLKVLGRRPDGYHELESLVAFADIGDVVTLDTDTHNHAPGRDVQRVTVSGPFAEALIGENLITITLERLAAACPDLRLGAVHLDKRLPVAAGIGGGSADAAAVLRAVRRANADLPSAQALPWGKIAAGLGADVPVCLANETAWMRGIGDCLEAVPGLPPLHIVLVNAREPVPTDKTARVFRMLGAPALAGGPVGRLKVDILGELATATNPAETSPNDHHARRSVLAFMRREGNTLEAATQQIVPGVADVLGALRVIADRCPGGNPNSDAPFVPVVAMSGAGPTCFAVLPSLAAANQAASLLRQAHPSWWVATTQSNS